MKRQLMIYFQNDQNTQKVTYKIKILVRRVIEATLEYENFPGDCEVSVTFTDDAGIRDMNRDFRGIDRATDVLSFPLGEFQELLEVRSVPLGDIVISLETAARQAEEFGHSFEREVAFLCVHSVLHLLGYDHVASEEEELEMRRRQREILEKMGLGTGHMDEV